MRPAPRHVLAASALLAVLAAATALWLALSLPMLGVEFAPAADGTLRVESVSTDSPNRALLRSGSRVQRPIRRCLPPNCCFPNPTSWIAGNSSMP
ncbi:MAG: hypothetical protein ABT05_06365 [Lautropia sp. SCN 66-9]|nr:MAG: hypothetical protein ABT05_06365 [Lautropia sp. SCN 66-9]